MIRPAAERDDTVDLSVIIVNYNVRYFLAQCLDSVRIACKGISSEIWVVDNASSDTSLEFLNEAEGITLIANKDNRGFAKANNQAIRRSKGRYVLLLNPDTLVPEDGFRKCLAYADAHPHVGALGIRMIDGRGDFLPESKRGFPSPWVSFTKMSGLSKLAPRSPRLNAYYLGHLGEFETNPVDVLPGAFMWLRADLLPTVGGGLDEDYFMYGEDIDLSYCIQKAGKEVVYFPEVSIVHYKGESTKKRSFAYVKTFYKAMAIFSRKHVTGGNAALQNALLQIAIYGRATLAVIINFLVSIFFVLIDGAAIAGLLLAAKNLWAEYYFNNPSYFEASPFETLSLPLYTVIWLVGIGIAGGYERPYRFAASFKGALLGSLFVLIAYALLPSELRTSRAVIVLTGLTTAALLPCLRLLWSFVRPQEVSMTSQSVGTQRRMAILGSEIETNRVLSLLGKTGISREYVGRIASDEASSNTGLGNASDLEQIAQTFRLEELIVCTQDVSISDLMVWMEQLGDRVEFRTVGPDSEAIVGSPSRNAPGDLYTVGVRYALGQIQWQRSKRIFDICLSLMLLLCWPAFFLMKKPIGAIRNSVLVLLGSMTWVGYASGGIRAHHLPKLRPCVLPQGESQKVLGAKEIQHLNELYARYYRRREDIRIVAEVWRSLGNEALAIHPLAPARWPQRNLTTVDYAKPYA
ncbi:MAG: glycosyltransferase family 2 protein [Saprospiraceae bacterium]